MKRKIEIDSDSGFCFGVVTAIRKAEEALEQTGGTLYCLGDIVHNAAEVERLQNKGLITITHEDLKNLHNAKVLLRAHGEPPSTYEIARQNGIEIIDATCPVVLQLQRRVKESASEKMETGKAPLILIYGKPGHAEVNGLVGQTAGKAIVVKDINDLENLDFRGDIRLYSQTTKSIAGFREIVKEIEKRREELSENEKGDFKWFDTICRQVSNRMDKIREFAKSHDAVIFVSGAKSSNGKVLYSECLSVNPNTFLISDASELDKEKLKKFESIGICGATSTPRWLMAAVAESLEKTEYDDK